MNDNNPNCGDDVSDDGDIFNRVGADEKKVASGPPKSCPIVRGVWDPKSAALVQLDGLYGYAAAAGDLPEVRRLSEKIARLVEEL